MSLPDQIDFSDEALEVASHWYGGMDDMLYAISSTGEEFQMEYEQERG